ncbi:copper homeostasis protein CutC [Sphingomonas sp. JC676]|uniref:copper homeostasis protein CutC n=1 Tax=Sphingomonas sp. JC676 TaxID=2768065 RepID=UPI001657EA2E|nr:copper homeostasis protein CutC [Sphingomonas sp. JC676]MBC9034703.1 copper homeostasis protein CutC [Sphingomonas sp. JC676]
MGALLEICVDDAAGIDAACAGGADRIELCSALELGGLTPSAALIEQAVGSGCITHMMIRPRAGGFVLESGEATLMLDEIRLGLARGVAGMVVGALRPDGSLDCDALARFRDAAQGATLVLHRAIDLVPDPVAAVREAAALGYDKVLSSGGAATAVEGAATLAKMVEAAGDRLAIIAGSGVTPENVASLIERTGVREVHGSASRLGPDPDADTLRLGFATGPRRRTDETIVRRLRAAVTDQGRPA